MGCKQITIVSPFPMISPPKTTYRADIDGLRAVAVMAVVAYHAFPEIVPGGFIGVDVFFVISGFLIGRILMTEADQGSFSYTSFVLRRIRRIIPALMVVLAVSLGVGYILLVPEDFSALARNSVAGSLFYANFQLLSEAGYTDAASETKPLLHLWSLAVEEQFYIFWPFYVWAVWRFSHRRLFWLCAAAGLSLLASLIWTPIDPTTSFFVPITRFWQMISGAILAYATMRGFHVRGPVGNALSALGLLVILLSVFLIENGEDYPGWRAIIPVLGALAVIARENAGPINGWVLASRPMVGIGLISYSLYLWHWPILVFAKHFAVYQNERFEIDTPSKFGAVALAFCLAIITYFLVERPTRHADVRSIAFWAVITGWIGVVAASSAIWLSFAWSGQMILGSKDNYLAQLNRRTGACFVDSADQPLASSCILPDDAKRSVFLVGDSYAAGFYSSLSENNSLSVSEFTSSSCPLNFGLSFPVRTESCFAINQARRKLMFNRDFDAVFIASWWGMLEVPGQMQNLVASVREILANTNSTIYLYGPSPLFYSAVPDIYRRKHSKSLDSWAIEAMNVYQDDRSLLLDAFADEERVKILDPVAVFCDGTITCRYKDAKDLFFADNGHLSLHGVRTLLCSSAGSQLVPDCLAWHVLPQSMKKELDEN